MSRLGQSTHSNLSPEPQDFRTYLQQELLKRCRTNSKYSLRAFASFLKVESSALSKILSGKRRISQANFRRLADRLGLDPVQREKLRPGTLTRAGSSTQNGGKALAPAASYQELSLDLFQVIADWYHYAILELTQIQGFRPDPRWIAKTLGITISEVNIAAERLVRLEMLKIDADGTWTDESGAVTNIQNELTTVALRRLQRQILEKSITALEEVPLERRDHTSMTMAIDSRLLPVAKERIKTFRRELCALLKSEGPLNEVYHLNVSLYPVGGSP